MERQYPSALGMNITQLLHTYQEQSGLQMNQINEFVAGALLHVVHTHIMSLTSSLVLTLCCRNNHTCNFYNQMMSVLFRNWGIAPLQVVTIQQDSTPRERYVAGSRHYNMIFTDSYAAFAEIDVESHTRDYNHNEYYYIFLQARDHLLMSEMRRIFRHCWRHQLINCNIQVQTAGGAIKLYTYMPYGPQGCDDMTPQLINSYNGSSMEQPLLFPRKLLNFYGCPLRAAIWQKPPFMRLLGADSDSDADSQSHARIVGGLEGRLLLTIAQRLNTSFDVRQPPNGTLSSLPDRAIQMLQTRHAELCVGGLRQTVVRRLLTTSTHSYAQLNVGFGVPDVSFELGSWDIMLYPYPAIIWFAIAGLLAFCALLKLSLKRLLPSDFFRPVHWLNMHLILVGMPMVSMNVPLSVSQSNSRRFFCMVVIVFSLLIRTIYQGMLYHLIRTHQLKPLPQSFEHLVEQNYTLLTTVKMREVLAEIPAMEQLTMITLDGNKTEANALEQLAATLASKRNRRLVVVTTLDVLFTYNKRTIKRALSDPNTRAARTGIFYKTMPQDLIKMQLSIYLSKHSFLIDELNEQIMLMQSVGLLSYWANLELSLTPVREDRSYRLFSLQELSAMFMLMASGLSLGTLIFVLELLSLRYAMLQRWLAF